MDSYSMSACTLVCARGVDIRNWTASVGFGGLHTQVPVSGQSEVQGPVTEASLDSKCLRPVTGRDSYCMYAYISH